ncbi:MAG: YfcE family phosphodiesterase [Patescibacteria group bacterium]|jgi:putative phosphoesterase|nr:YfcE family phosphodiesterase [Patescibacteria group bacterium]
MKIAILSDSHDNVPNIEKCLDWLAKNNIAAIIHCGDLAAPSMIVNEFGPKFKGQFHFVHGNVADRELNQTLSAKFANVTCHGDQGELELNGKKIVFNHYPDSAKALAESGKYDLVFYGHDHTPWEKTIGQTKMLNPGTLAGLFNKATFAVYDTATDKAELIILEKI